MALTFDQINTAIQNNTSYYLKKIKDDEGVNCYSLRDGCDDQDGDPFYELTDVVDYVIGNEGIAAELITNSVIG